MTSGEAVTVPDGASPPPRDDAPLSGRFGRYEIDRLLGRGGMGAVYLARQVDLDRRVVIKVVAPNLAKDRTIVARLEREARSAAKISSDNVVAVHETGVENGVPFIAMEYVDGCSVADHLRRTGPLPWQEAARIVAAAASGLRAAHDAQVLHRDVKPANILLASDGRVKVADFGLAKLHVPEGSSGTQAESTLSLAGQILGTPDYMAPEQAEGKTLDGRADLYALGVTFYELLTARRPFRGATPLKTISLALSATPDPPRKLVPSIPAEVERLCLDLMARDPDARPQTASEALARFEQLGATSPSGKVPSLAAPSVTTAPTVPLDRPIVPPTAPRPVPVLAPRPTSWASVVAFVVLLAGVGVFAVNVARRARTLKPPQPAPVWTPEPAMRSDLPPLPAPSWAPPAAVDREREAQEKLRRIHLLKPELRRAALDTFARLYGDTKAGREAKQCLAEGDKGKKSP